MIILTSKQVSQSCIKITTDAGLSFFVGTNYLQNVRPTQIVDDALFVDQEEEDIINAAFCFAAEKKACDYLSRCEQCRATLERKLLSKGFEKRYIKSALDYLEDKGLLSDERYAISWLNMRRITKSEGRARLLAELTNRGISRGIITRALDTFFKENNEEDLCRKALFHFKKLGKTDEKLTSSMLRAGFSFKMVQNVMKEET